MSLFFRAFSACKNDTEIAIWESTRFWHLSHCEVTTALASLHICADSFVWAFATVLKCRVFDQMVIGLSLIRAANAWRVCTFAWDTQQCDCEGESAQVCTESPESSSLDNALSPKGRVDSNGDMVHIYARNEGSVKSAHCTVNRFRFYLPFGFCIFQGALNGKMY